MSIEDAEMTKPRSQAVKRDGPETRTVVIGPERKKQRFQLVMPIAYRRTSFAISVVDASAADISQLGSTVFV